MTREQLKDFKVKLTHENARILAHVLAEFNEPVSPSLMEDIKNKKWHPAHSKYSEAGIGVTGQWVGLDSPNRQFMTMDQLIHELANLEPEVVKGRVELNEDLITTITSEGATISYKCQNMYDLSTRELSGLIDIINTQITRERQATLRDYFSLGIRGKNIAATALLFLERMGEKVGDLARVSLTTTYKEGQSLWLVYDRNRGHWVTKDIQPQGEEVGFINFVKNVLQTSAAPQSGPVIWGKYEVTASLHPESEYIQIGCQKISIGAYKDFIKTVNEIIYKTPDYIKI